MSGNAATYTLLPWVREGFRPTGGDDPGTLSVTLDVTGSNGDDETRSVDTTLSMYGPGEITGLDQRQIVRTEPEPGTGEFPVNHFPVVEFDRPDLPWLFSPESADSDGRLTSWLTLVTVERGEDVSIHADTSAGAAVLEIGSDADPATQLPDLTESWAWAHAQVVGADDEAAELEANRSEKTLSRLVSPRRLDPETEYLACVVPTFERGRLAGLGEDVPPRGGDDEEDGDDGEHDPLELAWDLDDAPTTIRLPVYYHWKFSTANAGDFKSLVQRLDPQFLEELGIRQVDAGDPGPEDLYEADGEIVSLEGALRSIGLSPDEYDDALQSELASILDDASGVATEAMTIDGEIDEEETPTHGPPIYGQWPPAAPTVPDDDGEPMWLRELNVDPRYRIPAGFGTAVINEEQEQLMAAAWMQVGEIREANKQLRQARLSRSASKSVHAAIDDLEPASAMLFTEPVQSKVLDDERTVAADVADSTLPAGVVSPAFRRITRPSGPLARRLGGIDPEAIVEGLNDGSIDIGDDGTPPDGARTFDADVAASLCTAASSRIEDEDDWDLRGDDPTARPHEILSDVGNHCKAVRFVLESTEDELGSSRHYADLFSELWDALDEICPEDDKESGLLFHLADVMAERDAEAIYEQTSNLLGVVTSIEDARDDLLERAGDDQKLAKALLSPPPLGSVIQLFADRVEDLVVALLGPLLTVSCDRARAAIDDFDEAVNTMDSDLTEEARAVVEELRTACDRLCGADEIEGLLEALVAALNGGRTRDVRRRLAAAMGLVEVAHDKLSSMPSDTDRNSTLWSARFAVAMACHQMALFLKLLEERLSASPSDPVDVSVAARVCGQTEPMEPPSLDLDETASVVVDAIDPAETIRKRMERRLGGVTLSDRDDPLDQILAHPEFPQPTYEELADLSQENLLPGIDDVDRDSVGLVETNPAFVESYLLGLNHEMARELRWRQYPTDTRGTYFRQFWDPEGRDPTLSDEAKKDIDYVHKWKQSLELGGNYAQTMTDKTGGDSGDASQLVLLVRGEVFRRYPNTIVYATKAIEGTEDDDPPRVPDLPDPSAGDGDIAEPLFRGRLEDDVAFFGFDLTVEDVEDPDGEGWFFVLEEPPSEPSFGIDKADPDAPPVAADDWEWSDLTWDNIDELDDPHPSYLTVAEKPAGSTIPDDTGSEPAWSRNAAHMGTITWQQPFRVAIHADDMLPGSGGTE